MEPMAKALMRKHGASAAIFDSMFCGCERGWRWDYKNKEYYWESNVELAEAT